MSIEDTEDIVLAFKDAMSFLNNKRIPAPLWLWSFYLVRRIFIKYCAVFT